MDTLEEIKLILKELATSQKETDLKFKETDKKFAETDKYLKNLGQQIGGLGEKFGYFTEGMALPSMEKILLNKFKVDTVMPRFKKQLKNGGNLEFDVLGYCNGEVNNAVVVEVKSRLRYQDIGDLVQELSHFKENIPELKDKHLYGILAAVDVPDKDLIKKVEESGLYFAKITGELFQMDVNKQAIDFNA